MTNEKKSNSLPLQKKLLAGRVRFFKIKKPSPTFFTNNDQRNITSRCHTTDEEEEGEEE